MNHKRPCVACEWYTTCWSEYILERKKCTADGCPLGGASLNLNITLNRRTRLPTRPSSAVKRWRVDRPTPNFWHIGSPPPPKAHGRRGVRNRKPPEGPGAGRPAPGTNLRCQSGHRRLAGHSASTQCVVEGGALTLIAHPPERHSALNLMPISLLRADFARLSGLIYEDASKSCT